MRRLIVVILAVALIVGLTAPVGQAQHRTATNVALGLASFAVFSQLFGPLMYYPYYPRPAYATYPTVVVEQPIVIERPVVVQRPVYTTTYYAPSAPYPYASQILSSQVVVVQPAPPPPPPSHPTVVQYPHGRYELRGDGIHTAYQWVWIPNAPPPPPAAPPPPPASQ